MENESAKLLYDSGNTFWKCFSLLILIVISIKKNQASEERLNFCPNDSELDHNTVCSVLIFGYQMSVLCNSNFESNRSLTTFRLSTFNFLIPSSVYRNMSDSEFAAKAEAYLCNHTTEMYLPKNTTLISTINIPPDCETIELCRSSNKYSRSPKFVTHLSYASSELLMIDPKFLNSIRNLKSLRFYGNKNEWNSFQNVVLPRNEKIESVEIFGDLYLSSRNLFRNLTSLSYITISKTLISAIDEFQLSGLNSLKYLNLSQNQLNTLPKNLFLDTSDLRELNLSANQIELLYPENFQHTPNLTVLDLSQNKIIFPNRNLLSGLKELSILSLAKNMIQNFRPNFFQHTPKLKRLNLEYNRLSVFFEELFFNNLHLESLALDHNKIMWLPDKLLANQNKLTCLKLNDNDFKNIPAALSNLVKIKELYLERNKFKYPLDLCPIGNLDQLQTLYLGSNHIINVTLCPEKFLYVKEIDLSFNNITSISDIPWNSFLRLQNANLKGNSLRYLNFSELPGEINFDFTLNKISLVDVPFVDVIDAKIKIYKLYTKNSSTPQPVEETSIEQPKRNEIFLKNNPFDCNCKLYGFYNFITNNIFWDDSPIVSDASDLSCEEPQSLQNLRIVDLNQTDFICKIDENCPLSCECYIRAMDSSSVVDCIKRNLQSFHPVHPSKASKLYLSENRLTTLKNFDTDLFGNLIELYVDSNHLASLDDWRPPPRLGLLDLRNNRLKTLTQKVMNHISHQDEFNLFLGGNEWNCNCEEVEFTNWITEQISKISDKKQFLCKRETQNGNFSLTLSDLETSNDELCKVSHMGKLIVFLVTFGLVITCVLSLAVVYYKHKQAVLVLMYMYLPRFFTRCLKQDELEDKMFDAFLSYGSHDCDIAYQILDKLEGESPHFKLCIHERNWLPGNMIGTSIAYSVEKSRRTILILSPEFLESIWFYVEFRTAYYRMIEEKINRLIIVVVGDLPPKESLDKDLNYVLSAKTYLVWGERWFWEKLRYVMPHKDDRWHKTNSVMYCGESSALREQVENEILFLTRAQRNVHQSIA